MRLDVGDSAQVYAAFLVYMNLTEGDKIKYRHIVVTFQQCFQRVFVVSSEVRGWSEVFGVSCPELQAVLLEGREKDGDTVQMIYPLPSHRSIKHRE